MRVPSVRCTQCTRACVYSCIPDVHVALQVITPLRFKTCGDALQHDVPGDLTAAARGVHGQHPLRAWQFPLHLLASDLAHPN